MNISSIKNSSTASYDLYISSIQYVVFGSVAFVTNLTILFILYRNVQYFKKSAFIAGLAFGDFLDGVSLTVIGAVRIVQYFDGTDSLTVHPSYCMKILIIPVFLMGNQIPGVMFFLVGLERFLAICCYDWYYFKWSNKFAWMLTASAYIYCILSVAASFVIAFSYDSDYKIGISCGTAAVIGPTYSAYNYGIPIVGGIVAAVATITAMVAFTQHRRRINRIANLSTNAKIHVKKQWQLTRITLCLVAIDFCFMVIPSIIITLSSGFKVKFNVNMSSLKAWSLQLVCFRSILNIILYLVINSDFRAAAFRALSLKTSGSLTLFTNSVSP